MNSPARIPFSDQPDAIAPVHDLGPVMSDAARRLGGLGRSAAAIAGSADDLGQLTDQAVRVFGDVQQSLSEMVAANRQIAERATQGVKKAELTHGVVRTALDRAAGLADAVQRVERGISEVSVALKQVSEASSVINKIAFQTRIVAFNASVEAVRAGDAGRGFGVVAQAVKDLAQQVGESSRQIASVIDELTDRIRELEHQVYQGGSDAPADGNVNDVVHQAVELFESNFGEVESLMVDTAQRANDTLATCDRSVETVRAFAGEFSRSVEIIRDVRHESGQLLHMSEEAIERFVHSGVETEDSPIINAAIDVAASIGQLFEQALHEGEISEAQLFDERYQPIAGTNPQQFMTGFVPFTDRVLPALQEPVLDISPLITFCAAVDRKAFLPTHNLKFSLPQGRDPVKNAANSRNRRIFNDRTGSRAAQNRQPFLLQTYRRDMGNGEFVVMKDVSAPIWVNGRHWGALRIGYRFAD